MFSRNRWNSQLTASFLNNKVDKKQELVHKFVKIKCITVKCLEACIAWTHGVCIENVTCCFIKFSSVDSTF